MKQCEKNLDMLLRKSEQNLNKYVAMLHLQILFTKHYYVCVYIYICRFCKRGASYIC